MPPDSATNGTCSAELRDKHAGTVHPCDRPIEGHPRGAGNKLLHHAELIAMLPMGRGKVMVYAGAGVTWGDLPEGA